MNANLERPTMGDVGAALKPFEKTLKVAHETQQQVVDGYVEPIRENLETFFGIVAPAKFFRFSSLGVHTEESTFLYVRLEQEDLPEIMTNDIIYEGGKRWRVTEEMDYEHQAWAKIFTVQKVT